MNWLGGVLVGFFVGVFVFGFLGFVLFCFLGGWVVVLFFCRECC